MSKATIYLYYKNKDDLFLHVVEDLVETAITETAQAAEAPGTLLEKLARMVRGKMAFYEREREFFHIYLNEKHGLDFNEKHGLEVAPKDPHKRLLQDMYLQGVDRLAERVTGGHGRRGAAADGGQTARLFPARDDEYSARAAHSGKSKNFRRGGCRTTARLFSPWCLAPRDSAALTPPDGCAQGRPRAFASSCRILVRSQQVTQPCPEPWGFPWRQPS